MRFRRRTQKLAEKLKIDVPVLVRGVLRGEDDSAPKLAVEYPGAGRCSGEAAGVAANQGSAAQSDDDALLEKLQAVFLGAPGPGKLLLDLEEAGEFCAVLEPHDMSVAADRLFIDRVEELVGRGGVRVID